MRYLMDAHPDVACPAEIILGAVSQGLLNTLELLCADADYRFETAVDSLAKRCRSIVDGFMLEYCAASNKSRWCDKSPANADFLKVLGIMYPDAQFVCLHRGVWDQVASSMEVDGPRRDFAREFLARHNGNATAAYIDRWCTTTETILAFERRHRVSCVRVTYEDLVADTDREMSRILSFVGVSKFPGLDTVAFAMKHSPGPGDQKIRRLSSVVRTQVGKGSVPERGTIPSKLLWRALTLSETIQKDI